MIEIRSLKQISAADLLPLIGAYTCTEAYRVLYHDSSLRTGFSLELVPLAQPYTGRYEHINEVWVQNDLGQADYRFGAYAEDQLVGVLIAERRDWNQTLWVWEFHVAAGHRRRGIGRQLMEHAARLARAAGLRAIVCETQNRNANAIKAYRQLGFRPEGIDISYYSNRDFPDQDIAIFMKRRLDE